MDDPVIGDEPLADGMLISVRVRRDFVVADADRVLRAARRAYVEISPGATDEDAAEFVTSATDAIFALIERAGLIGQGPDDFLLSAAEGLAIGGQVTQVTVDKDQPLPTGHCSFGGEAEDVFALPPEVSRPLETNPEPVGSQE
ncbi:MAG TPA: hypothetical protein VFI65_15940 [Streptosporangiaceae bacterium]|nr:hypothetical protein [Streptosporangiaceae bacterium]